MNRGEWAKYVRSFLERMIAGSDKAGFRQVDVDAWVEEAKWLLEQMHVDDKEGTS